LRQQSKNFWEAERGEFVTGLIAGVITYPIVLTQD
jgi:hypothetical protein